MNPQVQCIPRVSWHTAGDTVRYVPVPTTGTVYAGTGTVYEIRTRGIPVPNPNDVNLCLESRSFET